MGINSPISSYDLTQDYSDAQRDLILASLQDYIDTQLHPILASFPDYLTVQDAVLNNNTNYYASSSLFVECLIYSAYQGALNFDVFLDDVAILGGTSGASSFITQRQTVSFYVAQGQRFKIIGGYVRYARIYGSFAV